MGITAKILAFYLIGCCAQIQTPNELKSDLKSLTEIEQNKEVNDNEGYGSNVTKKELEDSKEEILQSASDIIQALKTQNFTEISQFVSSEKGLTLTPYTVVREGNLTFSREEVALFDMNNTNYIWGQYEGSGFNIEHNPRQYFNGFVYDKNFEHSHIAYNEIQQFTGWPENMGTAYPNGIFVEYYYEGDEGEFKGFTWATLRLVFEKSTEDGKWYLVGLIHSQWTI